VTGADAVETYSPANGYELVTDLAPGQGALVFSYTGNQITLTAEAGTVSGSPQQSLPAGTPAATAPVGGSPTPAQTASPPQTIPTALPPQ
ncbi:MAG TPA: hypothetical protein VND24_09870, partial [Steroidobacteraceae bacterium]|nr:hypothetical protein [Steroidobacteraceae bacterium]